MAAMLARDVAISELEKFCRVNENTTESTIINEKGKLISIDLFRALQLLAPYARRKLETRMARRQYLELLGKERSEIERRCPSLLPISCDLYIEDNQQSRSVYWINEK